MVKMQTPITILMKRMNWLGQRFSFKVSILYRASNIRNNDAPNAHASMVRCANLELNTPVVIAAVIIIHMIKAVNFRFFTAGIMLSYIFFFGKF